VLARDLYRRCCYLNVCPTGVVTMAGGWRLGVFCISTKCGEICSMCLQGGREGRDQNGMETIKGFMRIQGLVFRGELLVFLSNHI
jgi:hypothetical protein